MSGRSQRNANAATRSSSSSGRATELVEFDDARLHALALGYLNRFDASVSGLREVVMRKVRRALSGASLPDQERASQLTTIQQRLDALLTRFQGSGLIDDARLARHLVGSWRDRGMSARAIQARLLKKGVPSRVVDTALGELANDPQRNGSEIDAAVAFARRRKLGCFGSTPADRGTQRRDLARMARAGFDFDVSLRALNVRVDDDTF
ncbi:MAG TPA: regulatory protein RecX [Polyangiaceae bacterium]|nr:regulatory protein RecX [Polyangiaceae bacterium]